MAINKKKVRKSSSKVIAKPKVIYAITAGGLQDLGNLVGINKSDIYTIEKESISFVVSDLTPSSPRPRPDRRNIMAHNEILKQLMTKTSVLPVRFGTVATGESAVKRFCTEYNAELLEQLDHVQDRVEMGIRVTWNVPNIYDYFVDNYPELRAERDRVYDGNKNPRRDDRINLGHLYDDFVKEARLSHQNVLEEMVLPSCDEIHSIPPKDEKVVVNLACLVQRADLEVFEQHVFEAGKTLDNTYEIELNGPWAPHNFVELDLKTMTGRR